jgi:hypothetical protein
MQPHLTNKPFRVQDTALGANYEQLLLDDEDEGGVLDSISQVAHVELTGATVDGVLIERSDQVTLFLAGRSLRRLLDELFGGV